MATKARGIQQNLVQTMRLWQGSERKAIASTGAVSTALAQVRGRKMRIEDEKQPANLLPALATIKSGLCKVP